MASPTQQVDVVAVGGNGDVQRASRGVVDEVAAEGVERTSVARLRRVAYPAVPLLDVPSVRASFSASVMVGAVPCSLSRSPVTGSVPADTRTW